MIIGIGVDSVEIARFNNWHTYTNQQLLRIFCQAEIDHCLSCPVKSAERFAARFAVREAFYKAVLQTQPDLNLPLLKICKAVYVAKNQNGSGILHIDWPSLPLLDQNNTTCHVSWSHTATLATAFVILNKR